MIGAVPDQLPGSAVSVCPTVVVPDTVGSDVFAGATGPGVTTTAVGLDVALLDPYALEPVTATCRVLPASFATRE